MEITRHDAIEIFANPGMKSMQLLHPGNAGSARVTITRVTLEPGAINARQAHEGAGQVWIALSGSGELLLAGNTTAAFVEGDVAGCAPGDVHGFRNTGASAFIYLAVTSPPLDFRRAYESQGDAS